MPVVIAFISQKGGVGKSTLARAVAVAAVGNGHPVRLADLDIQQRTLVFWGEARTASGLEPAIRVEAFANAADAIAAARPGELMLLDAGGQVSDATLALVRRAQLVVQPTGPSLDDLRPALMLFRALGNLGVPDERLAFAVCRNLNKAEEDATRAYLAGTGYAVLPGAIPERAAYRAALDLGRSPTECDDATAGVPTELLVQALLARIDALSAPDPQPEDARLRQVRKRA